MPDFIIYFYVTKNFKDGGSALAGFIHKRANSDLRAEDYGSQIRKKGEKTKKPVGFGEVWNELAGESRGKIFDEIICSAYLTTNYLLDIMNVRKSGIG